QCRWAAPSPLGEGSGRGIRPPCVSGCASGPAAGLRCAANRKLTPCRQPPRGTTMPLQCPHCQSTIVLEGKLPPQVICPSCGSSTPLDPNATAGWLPEEAPNHLAKFEVLEHLGVGSFGTVYKARDTELARLVALKAPRRGSLPRAEDLDRFLREAKSAAQLKH